MGELAKIESFNKEIALAETWEEIKNLETKGAILAELAKKAGIAIEGQNKLGKSRIDLEEKKAIWLNEFFPHGSPKGESGKLRGTQTEPRKMPVPKKESAQARLIEREKELVRKAIEEIENDKKKVITPASVASKVRQKKREENIEEQKRKIKSGEISLPEGVFDIVVIDPPWPYGRKYDPDGSRSASPYPEMSQDELKAIELGTADDCILWLWTTHRFIWDAKELLDHWGFEYKAMFIWNKDKMGIGYWLRMQCEFCLLGIKGKPLWNVKDLRDILIASGTDHSSKPDEFYKMIDDNFISKSEYKADFFGRKERPGWKINNEQ